jgi:hypothetical protein
VTGLSCRDDAFNDTARGVVCVDNLGRARGAFGAFFARPKFDPFNSLSGTGVRKRGGQHSFL